MTKRPDQKTCTLPYHRLAFSCRDLCLLVLLLGMAGDAFSQSASARQVSRLASGIDLYSQGKWHEAVSELRRIQAEAPSRGLRGEALFWISLSQLSAGAYGEALKDMDALAEADPHNPRLADLPYHRGRVLYYLGRYDEAILNLKGFADSIKPGSGGALSSADSSRKSAALFWIGESLYSMGQLDRAGDVFRIVIDEYPGSPKYEASVYRLALINQKKVELELLGLLKWSHEEALRNMEEFRLRESSYDQALSAYQKRITEMERDARALNLEESNSLYREQLESAEERIRYLESTLIETSANLERARNNGSAERLNSMKASAQELVNILEGK